MIITVVLLVGLIGILGYAVHARIANNRYRMDQGEIIDSPMTQAIGQLLGISGGIYLSLVMVISFLGIEQPEKIIIFTLAMDPLAVISIILALIQPMVIHWLRKIIN